jgi:hypothetical protein
MFRFRRFDYRGRSARRRIGSFGEQKARRQSREFPQALLDMAEVESGLQPPASARDEDVTARVAGRVASSSSVMGDDQNLALPRRYLRLNLVLTFRLSFQDGGVRSSTMAQCTLARNSSILEVVSGHGRSSRLAQELDRAALRSFSAPALPGDREAVAQQGRAKPAGACDGPLWARPTTPQLSSVLALRYRPRSLWDWRADIAFGRIGGARLPMGLRRGMGQSIRRNSAQTSARRVKAPRCRLQPDLG